jgi:hypothetical protein
VSKDDTSPSAKELVPLLTAIIGVIGTVAAAYFAYRGAVAPKELELSATRAAATQLARIPVMPTSLTQNPETPVPADGSAYQGAKGYALFWDGILVSTSDSAGWTCGQGLENLLWNIKQYPEKAVEGRFDGKKMDIAGTGYELFFDCQRVGHEPDWTSEQAIENLLQNISRYPEKDVDGWLNGQQMTP